MAYTPFHIDTVIFHLEEVLITAAGSGRRLRPAAKRMLALLKARGLGLGVVSRESRNTARARMRAALNLRPADIRTFLRLETARASGRRHNPFRAAAKSLRSVPQRFMVVSRDLNLLALAKNAGAVAVEWRPKEAPNPADPPTDYRVGDFGQLAHLIRMGTPLPAGKLPNDLLKLFLEDVGFEDPALLITPGVGEDIAAVDVSAEEVLVLKSDPITFATDAIGQYAVLVNANDIATAGAEPRWLLTTLLFPIGTTPSFIWSVVFELREFCRTWGITLCGGHTEITDAVTRPVISGMMAGSVRKRDLIDKRRVRPGDRLLLTKGAAVEGTAIIARELGSQLTKRGMSAKQISSCQAFLERISIIPEARLAAKCPGTSAMHDVTEGGIATAIEELSAASGCRLRVDLERIPVFAETRRLCRLLDLHPLGLIGSGSLLICCRPRYSDRLQQKLRSDGVPVACIGEVAEKGVGVQSFKRGRPVRWPRFEVDEIARLFNA
jgi:hydrogenase maturation factor